MLRKETMQLMVAVALLTATISLQAHNKVVVVPLSGDEAPMSKVVFITEQLFTGSLGGPTGADERRAKL